MRAGRILIILPLISFLFSACSLKMRPIPLQIIVNTSDVIMTERQGESTESKTEIASEETETAAQSEAQQKEFSTEPVLITTEPIEITTAPEEITTGPVEITTGPVTTEAAMTTELVITEPPLSYGTFGRLDIPSIGIGVALNYVDLRDGTAQSVVDAYDSAAYFFWHDCKYVIADHNNQGFANLRNAQVGSYAQISKADGYVDTYICTRVCTDGRNTQYDLLDEYGISADSFENCCLLMYTCNQDWEHITLTFWEKA